MKDPRQYRNDAEWCRSAIDEAVCEGASKLFMKKAKSLTKLAERIEDAMIELGAIRDRVFNIQDSLLGYTNQFELMSERNKPHQDQ